MLIATGASPVVPKMQGADAKGIFSLPILQSGIDVFNHIEKNHPLKAVVVGGGYIFKNDNTRANARGFVIRANVFSGLGSSSDSCSKVKLKKCVVY